MITPDDDFFKHFNYYIKKRHKINAYCFSSLGPEDPFDMFIFVVWKNNNQKYKIKIDKAKLGPARLKDAVDLFDRELKNAYPELLL